MKEINRYMVEVNPSSVITLNGLNFPIKRQRLADWIFLKNRIHLCVVYKIVLLDRKTRRG